MTAANSSHPRQMVPRWRAWNVTASMGEAANGFGVARHENSENLEMKLLEYQNKPDIGRASDLLATAIVYGQTASEVEKVANQILAKGTSWKLVEDLANRVVVGKNAKSEGPYEPDTKLGWSRISRLKISLRNHPRNALKWVDLSREYMILGQSDQASAAMRVARHLAPQNRFVLRSTATLLWEQDLPGLAVEALRASDAHLSDPWLLAPIIALRDLAKMKPQGIRDALRLIEDGNFPKQHTAELAAALGTMEFENGSDRRGRQLFRKSLETPVENVVAQAVWLTDKKKVNLLVEIPPEVVRAHEAISRHEAQELKWIEATDAASDWLGDQPFSTQAASYGSWTACEAKDWTSAMNFSHRGLMINPSNALLLNNLAFSQVQSSNLSDAVQTLEKARSVEPGNSDRGALTATEGLALFRAGYFDLSRVRYNAAIEIFSNLKEWDSAADAAIMIALEEVTSNSEHSKASLERARRLLKNVKNPRIFEHMQLLETANSLSTQSQSSPNSSGENKDVVVPLLPSLKN